MDHIKLSSMSFKTGHVAVFVCLLYIWISVSTSCKRCSFLRQHIPFKWCSNSAGSCTGVSCWEGLWGSREKKQGKAFMANSPLCKQGRRCAAGCPPPPRRAAQDSLCSPSAQQACVPRFLVDTVPSAFWVFWQPFAVPIQSLQIRCLFSSSAKSKQTACSDISTNVVPLLRQPSKHGFQTKHGLRLFKDGPWIPPSIHPSRIQK